MCSQRPAIINNAAAINGNLIGSFKKIMDTMAPINGASPKYAPVLAVPMCRSARTNRTRLIPYPKKPIKIEAAITAFDGSFAPIRIANKILVKPALRPFKQVICIGLAFEIFLVKLLSTAQKKHAPAISKTPFDSFKPKEKSTERKTPPRIINSIPRKILLSKFSLKTNHAISAVKTLSKFKNNDVAEA